MPHVLIVDQDPIHTDIVKAALAHNGATASVMTDGALALQSVRTDRPDAIVVSVDLKGFSGYSVCNKLKKDPALARVPLLLISADASEETFAQHSRLKTRAEGYLRKPFDERAAWRAVEALWAPPSEPAAKAEPSVAASGMQPVEVSWAPSATTPATAPLESAMPPAEPEPEMALDEAAADAGAPAAPGPAVRERETDMPEEATMIQQGPLMPPVHLAEASEGEPVAAARAKLPPERTQPAGDPAAAPAAPEVTVRRVADPEFLAMSRRRGGARAPVAGGPAPAAGPSEEAWAARLAEVELGYKATIARLESELAAQRQSLTALAARLEKSQATGVQARKTLAEALEVLGTHTDE